MGTARLQAQQARDGLEIILHPVVDFADHRLLHGQLLFLLPERGHILHHDDPAQQPPARENRQIAAQKHKAARLDFLFRRALRLHRLPRDMPLQLRRVEAHPQERADAEHTENMLGGGVRVNDPLVGVGDQDAVPRRNGAVHFPVERAARILQDHSRRVHEAAAFAFPQAARRDLEADDGDSVLAVVDAVGVRFETVGAFRVAAQPDQRLPRRKRPSHQRLRRRRDKLADRREAERLHHRMGARLR